MKLIKFLNYPYPFYENSKQGLGICLSIGVFIASFCYFFKPFGLDQVSSTGLLGYGLVSFVVCSLFIVVLPLIFKFYLKTEGWKIYKELLWIFLIVISLAIANYYYSGLFFDRSDNTISTFLFVVFCTALIALIPAIAIILYKQLFVYKKIIRDTQKLETKIALQTLVHQKLDNSTQAISFISENNNDNLSVQSNDICYLSSSGNYVEIFYHKEGIIEKKLLRNNISKIEKQLVKFPRLARCHRSFIINLDKIVKVNGNLQGYQLKFEGIDKLVPVSRSYTKLIKSEILYN